MANESSDSNRAAPDGFDSWKAYWTAQEMRWRTEPAIDDERQRYLTERQAITPDIARGIYPFRDEHGRVRLSRADVEWLLATHDSGRGPVEWNDLGQRNRKGLDLRGADLCGVRLSELPLASIRASLNQSLWSKATPEQRERAAAHFEGANLFAAHLEDATLRGVHLEGSSLKQARLEQAHLKDAHLAGANLSFAHLQRTSLAYAQLGPTSLAAAHLNWVHERVPGFPANLAGASLSASYCDEATKFEGCTLADRRGIGVSLVDAHLASTNLSVMRWSDITMLGEEREALQAKDITGKRKETTTRLQEYERAVRANRQLATLLRSQGLNEHADRFSFRAQLLQREVLRFQRKLGQWLFSWALSALTGYGYRLQRIFITYVLTLSAFAIVYFVIGLPSEHVATLLQKLADAYQVSLTALHGRTFFEQFGIGSTLAWVAAAESVCGLVIEAVFTSMLVQRFFAR